MEFALTNDHSSLVQRLIISFPSLTAQESQSTASNEKLGRAGNYPLSENELRIDLTVTVLVYRFSEVTCQDH